MVGRTVENVLFQALPAFLLGHRQLSCKFICLLRNSMVFVGFKIFSAVTMKSAVFWDVALMGLNFSTLRMEGPQ
jgi:hypothetical protein